MSKLPVCDKDGNVIEETQKIPAETFEDIWAREREAGERKYREAMARTETLPNTYRSKPRGERWLDRGIAVLTALGIACAAVFLSGLLGFLIWASAGIWRHILGG